MAFQFNAIYGKSKSEKSTMKSNHGRIIDSYVHAAYTSKFHYPPLFKNPLHVVLKGSFCINKLFGERDRVRERGRETVECNLNIAISRSTYNNC